MREQLMWISTVIDYFENEIEIVMRSERVLYIF